MANKSKKKGTGFETSLLPALKKLDPRVERSALHGRLDRGDFTVLAFRKWANSPQTMAVSAKNCRQMSLSGWLTDAEKMRVNASADAAVVVHKKRGTTAPEEQYCTLTLGTLLKLLT